MARMNEIEKRIYTAEIVNDLYREVEQKIRNITYTYEVVGQEQARKWNRETGEYEPQWYGSLDNRLEENRMFVDEIKVGTGMTEYFYSDRKAYEVVAVKDQKHVSVRRYDHKHVGEGQMDNSWELISNPNNAVHDLVKRGDTWYWSVTVTAEDLDKIGSDIDERVRLAVAGFNEDIIRAKGKQTKRHRANVSFGIADYYYDYSF